MIIIFMWLVLNIFFFQKISHEIVVLFSYRDTITFLIIENYKFLIHTDKLYNLQNKVFLITFVIFSGSRRPYSPPGNVHPRKHRNLKTVSGSPDL